MVIETRARPGDSWRSRYRSLVLHDPVWYDHLPYIPFPDSWPVFTPKDKMGDRLEAHALAMELDCWGGTECVGARREDGLWQIDLRGEGRPERITAAHLVFATGACGPPRMPDWPGLMMKAYRTGSGYDIDVGASRLIVEGAIGVAAGAGVARLVPGGVELEDGRLVEADAVVACTGYHSMHETVAAPVSRAAADRVGPCRGLGSGVPGDPGPWQGDLRNMRKPTAEEALWFHGGNRALSRFCSRILALRLKARMEGVPAPVWGAPAPQA